MFHDEYPIPISHESHQHTNIYSLWNVPLSLSLSLSHWHWVYAKERSPVSTMGEITEKSMEESFLLKEKSEVKNESVTWSALTQELKRVGCIAGPMVAVTLTQNLMQVISLMMVGHLGELSLSSTAMAISLAAVTGFSLLVSVSLLIFKYHLVNITKEKKKFLNIFFFIEEIL